MIGVSMRSIEALNRTRRIAKAAGSRQQYQYQLLRTLIDDAAYDTKRRPWLGLAVFGRSLRRCFS